MMSDTEPPTPPPEKKENGISRLLCTYLVENPVLFMICGAIAGFLLAYLIFFFEELPGIGGEALVPVTGFSTARGILNEYPNFFTWIMLFIIHTGMATSLGLAAFQIIKGTLLSRFALQRHEVVASAALVFAMVVVSSTSYIVPFNAGHYFTWPELPLNHLWTKVIILLAISIFAASFGVLGLIYVGCHCRQLLSKPLPEDAIELYGQLKGLLDRFLLIIGLILSVGILTVYFFYAALLDLGRGKQMGAHGVAIFGLLFTIFIAISFIPSRLLLLEFGNKIVAEKLPSKVQLPASGFKEWVEARKELEQYLELKLNWAESLKYIIPVLGPIISSLLPNALQIF